MDFSRVLKQTSLLILCIYLSACGKGLGTTADTISALQQSEDSYCSTSVTVTNPITITSTANYYYRATNVTTGLTGDPVLAKIPYAEVMVLNSAGTIVACSNTGVLGQISVPIQNTPGTYTLKVTSRANNSKIKLSILKDITSNSYYSISTSFTLSSGDAGTKAVSQLYAYARVAESTNIEGGAFNILADIYKVNEYIRTTIGNAAWVASKVTVYWKAGFNPYSYFGSAYANTPISFYSTGQRKLYILGGLNGTVKNTDTDHFDDTIVIHEYGHFLEDVYAQQDSPGGSHDGNFIIDPRLAWSEGWANFLQSAVITNWDTSTNSYSLDANIARGKFYIDTTGYSNDSTETGETGHIGIKLSLVEDGRNATMDQVTANGEGNFRELSVSRALYKAISDASVTAYGAEVPFAAIWTVFTDTVSGFKAATANFRNIGLFNYYLDLVINANYASTAAAWANVLSNEYQKTTAADYGDSVSWDVACASYPRTMSPTIDADYYIDAYTPKPMSNKFRSNDFYSFYYNGSGGTITVSYTQGNGAVPIDLDLVVYNLSHSYYENWNEAAGEQASDYGVAVRSARRYPASESGSEIVSLAGLSAGYYLINVKAYTYQKLNAQVAGGSANYTMTHTQGGTTRYLCPLN